MAEAAIFEPNLEAFYRSTLDVLQRHEIPFLVGGGLAVAHYSQPSRVMKDVDIFCKSGEFLHLIEVLGKAKIEVEVVDERWLAKAKCKHGEIDIIFSSQNYINKVDDSWFERAREIDLLGLKLKLVGPEDVIWCKIYIQDRSHYDGADVNHLILDQGLGLDWKHLLTRMEADWELLFGALLNFRYVYPSMRGRVPAWLMADLSTRLRRQLEAPLPQEKTCRGPLIARYDYEIDMKERDFKVIT
jgi:predicted nucleotidyltransferase